MVNEQADLAYLARVREESKLDNYRFNRLQDKVDSRKGSVDKDEL